MSNLHTLRLLLQSVENLCGLQRDMRANAQAWKASALAQADGVDALAQYMGNCAVQYRARLGWMDKLRADAGSWVAVAGHVAALGCAEGDFDAIIAPLRAAVQQMDDADKSSHAAIAAACDAVLAAVPAPLSLWPE